MKVMVTGHRPQRLRGHEDDVRKWFYKKIQELEPTKCISGMAQGADQIWAECVIKAGIPLSCYFPFPPREVVPAVQNIIDKADEICYCSDKYSTAAYFVRDRAMVDAADVVLVVWDGEKGGGTYETMEYAKKMGKKVYILNVSNERVC